MKGHDLLQIPLWNSVFFKREVKSRVQENKFRTFYCPALVAKGLRTLGECATAEGQLRSYWELYVQLLLPYIDAPPREWKLSMVLKECRRYISVEERQPESIWMTLHAQHIPFRLKEFIIVALWRKLPVAQRLSHFGVLNS